MKTLNRTYRRYLSQIEPGRSRAVAGLSLVELMVTLTITLIAIGGATSVLIQVMTDNAVTRARLDAVSNGRAALRDMAFEIKTFVFNGPDPVFYGDNQPGETGDGLDNDGDGFIDEERPDGQDNDSSFADRHTVISGRAERDNYQGLADLGDGGVDEDTVFDSDRLTLRFDPGTSGVLSKEIQYYIGSFEGRSNVLLRREILQHTNGASSTAIAPLAYDALALNLLYWDANLVTPYWVEMWDSEQRPFPGPGFDAPACVYLETYIYSGASPYDMARANGSVETARLATAVNIESVITDPRYEMIRPVE